MKARRLFVPNMKVDLVCEQGHIVHASALIPLGIDGETGEYSILTGDDWAFCDFCEPCENYEACLESGTPCELCERGWRSEASQEAGRLLVMAQVDSFMSGRAGTELGYE